MGEENVVHRIHFELLELMKRFHMMARDNSLQYGIEGGTLLGAVRERGIIAHDDDIDVYMKQGDYDRIPEFCEQYGLQPYYWSDGWTGVKLYGVEEGEITAEQVNSAPFIDVFLRVEKDHGYVAEGAYEHQIVKKSEVDSPTVYKLDGMYLHGPSGASDEGGYLERVYGEDWREPKKTVVHIDYLRPDKLENKQFENFKPDQIELSERFADSQPKALVTLGGMSIPRKIKNNYELIGTVVAVIIIIVLVIMFLRRSKR